MKPTRSSWSMGQLYMHLLEETYGYFEQIKICLGNSEDAQEAMSEKAREMFRNNGFPNEMIKGDPFISDQVEESSHVKALTEKFEQLKIEAMSVWGRINSSKKMGKRKHPGLGFFDPMEWFQ